jgi:hypothetical protein
MSNVGQDVIRSILIHLRYGLNGSFGCRVSSGVRMCCSSETKVSNWGETGGFPELVRYQKASTCTAIAQQQQGTKCNIVTYT